ncbi:MAG TPA: YfcC family protein, partial [Clostridiales bacterium]|nr:YfcC family protein [Clostridiales bacterium]
MNESKTKKKKFSMPHAYVIMIIIIALSMVLTWVLPAGSFQYEYNEALDRDLVVPGSFQLAEEQSPIGPWGMVISIFDGVVQAGDIIFFILFAAAYVYVLSETGALNALTGAMLRKLGKRDHLIIPIFMILFAIGGTTIGMYEETYGLIPAFMIIAVTLGYDRIVGGAIVFVGVATGFAAAILNPFTIGIASSVAQVPMIHEKVTVLRFIAFFLFMALTITYVMRYAAKVRKDPTKSIMYGDPDALRGMENVKSRDEVMQLPFTQAQKISLFGFVLLIAGIALGIVLYGWYLSELAALFFVFMVATMIVNRMTTSEMAEMFVNGCKSALFGAMLVGFARAISLVMEQGQVIDTAVNFLAGLVGNMPASIAGIGMLIVQNIVNFFIPSGSGQAVVMMPIMAPLSDLVGLSREVAVVAYQFGDGFSNMFWPTAVATECGIMGIGMDKWYKFITPLFAMMF